jgi:hypothetical protein
VLLVAEGLAVTVGVAPRQADLMKGTASFVAGRVKDNSIFAVLHRECHVLFPDDLFADLFAGTGRRSVPPRIVAVVIVLQRLFGLSDRDAVEAFEFDARWKYAAGGLDFDYPGFAHTVLVDMRARLARSAPAPADIRGEPGGRSGGRPGGGPPGAGLDPVVRRGGHHGHRHHGPLRYTSVAQRSRRRLGG